MDFSRIPATALLKIFQYLPFEDRVRLGRVNKSFRQISQVAVSGTKSLDLTENRFRKITADQLGVILGLCSPNLERIGFGGGEDWLRRSDDRWQQMAITFAQYEYPRMIEINLSFTPVDRPIFEQLIRNCPNVELLVWFKNFVGFPTMTNNNLKKLQLQLRSDASLQSMVGHCPNLEEIYLSAGNEITAGVLDQFFGSVPRAHLVSIDFFNMRCIDFERAPMVNFYRLPLTSLNIDSNDSIGDGLLSKVVKSFPNLKQLRLSYLKPTNQVIESLAALRELQSIRLKLSQDGEPYDQGIRQLAQCQNLQELNVYLSNMTGGTLVNFLRSCPQLECVDISDITDVKSPEEAAVVLGSLAGIQKREVTIRFYLPKENFVSIWKGEAAKSAIKKLEDDEGIKIKIEIGRWPC